MAQVGIIGLSVTLATCRAVLLQSHLAIPDGQNRMNLSSTAGNLEQQVGFCRRGIWGSPRLLRESAAPRLFGIGLCDCTRTPQGHYRHSRRSRGFPNLFNLRGGKAKIGLRLATFAKFRPVKTEILSLDALIRLNSLGARLAN